MPIARPVCVKFWPISQFNFLAKKGKIWRKIPLRSKKMKIIETVSWVILKIREMCYRHMFTFLYLNLQFNKMPFYFQIFFSIILLFLEKFFDAILPIIQTEV